MNKKSLLLISLLALVGCGEVNTSNEDNSFTSSEENNTSSVDYSSPYGEVIGEQIISNVKVDLPFMEADEYKCNVSTDDYGDPLVCLYLIYNDTNLDLDEKLSEYASICENEGYTTQFTTQKSFDSSTMSYTEYNLYFADKNIDDVYGIELQFLVGAKDGKDCIGVFAFNYVIVDPTCWPSNLVEHVIGEDVPHLPENNYTYSASQEISEGVEYVFISIKGAYYDEQEEYKKLLENLGFTIDDSEYDTYGYFATSPEQDYIIQFKYDDVSNFDLEIYIWRLK